ncbi:hypothetical protein KI387_008393, partial [Taxus chinensis]
MRGTRKGESAERGKKLPKSCFRQCETVGTKVREVRGSASLAQVSPFQAVQRDFSQAVWDSWDESTRRKRKAEGAESQWNLATCLHRKQEQGSPNRVVWRYLSQAVWDSRAK